jgi:hypothetical protein
LGLILSLSIPSAAPASATEKCLASFADSEWSNGTPAAVKSVLGFDLIEKITKTPDVFANILQPFYLFGSHTEVTTYNYVGKNCLTRNILTSKSVDAQSVKIVSPSINEYISQRASNFQVLEDSLKHYASVRDYFNKIEFAVDRKPLIPQIKGGVFYIAQTIRNSNQTIVFPYTAFIHFPTKCAYRLVEGRKEFAFNIGLRIPNSRDVINFESNGRCNGKLMLTDYSGVISEDLSDIRYLVTDSSAPTTMTCKKGKLTTKVKGANPKCPKGFKKV